MSFASQRSIRAGVVVLASVAALGPAVQAPSSASAEARRGGCCLEGIHRDFSLETGELIFKGYATADGYVAFESRRRAAVQAAVTDWCDHNPGDGLGAGLYADIDFGDGSRKLEYLFGDFNGCTNDGPSGFGTHSVPNPADKRIVAVQMLLCYEDPDVSGIACESQKRSRIIDNPY
ncbi:hypothetical protein [Nocardioides sp. MH1]|uniref:hypothetical protein n=1 Tax=Nocardioides sp. MH1 TaxID=3242490 RepID=UPI0035203EC2